MTSQKAFFLLIVSIISLNIRVYGQGNEQKKFAFYDSKDTVVLQKNEYAIKHNAFGFNLTVINKDKQKKISALDKPNINFTVKGAEATAVGLFVLSAAMPMGHDYFFPLNGNNGVFFIKSNSIEFTRIPKPDWKKEREELIFKDAPFKQCHASTLVETTPGVIMVAWFGGSYEGSKDVKIWMSRLEKGKWLAPWVAAEGEMKDTVAVPLWNPVLFKSNSGKLFLFYKAGPNPREWWGMMKTSDDNGRSWSATSRLPDGILGPIKNKPVQLKDGSILSPSSTETNEKWQAHIERSTDDGTNWELIPVDHGSALDVIQPSILFYEGGKRLQMLCRSKQRTVVESWSADNGKSWSALSKTSLLNPNSGTDALTLKNGTQLIVYNPDVPGKDWFNGRFKLNVAMSRDGKTWTDIAILENGDAKKEYSYPAIIQTKDGKVHITYTFDRKNIKHVVLSNTK
ncbi:sialidase family protein [Pedobacter frigoris]|nr:sialidase family protein [Pedobacter frigoris]